MSVYRPEKSPYWHYDFRHKGVRFHGSTETKNKAKARLIESRTRAQAADLVGGKRIAMTLNEAAGRFYEEVARHQASARIVDCAMNTLIGVLGKDTLLSEITDDEITQFVSARQADKKANGTINNDLAMLRRIFRRARDTWRVDIGDMPV